MKRFEGATKNLETALARSMDNEGRGGFLTKLTDAAGKATMALAELPQPVLAVGAAAMWVGGKVSGVAGTVALVSAAFSLKGSAAALTAAAARLGRRVAPLRSIAKRVSKNGWAIWKRSSPASGHICRSWRS